MPGTEMDQSRLDAAVGLFARLADEFEILSDLARSIEASFDLNGRQELRPDQIRDLQAVDLLIQTADGLAQLLARVDRRCLSDEDRLTQEIRETINHPDGAFFCDTGYRVPDDTVLLPRLTCRFHSFSG